MIGGAALLPRPAISPVVGEQNGPRITHHDAVVGIRKRHAEEDGRGARLLSRPVGPAVRGAQNGPAVAHHRLDVFVDERDAQQVIQRTADLRRPGGARVRGPQDGSLVPHRGPQARIEERDAFELHRDERLHLEAAPVRAAQEPAVGVQYHDGVFVQSRHRIDVSRASLRRRLGTS